MEGLTLFTGIAGFISAVCAIILFFIGRKNDATAQGRDDAAMKYDIKYIRETSDDIKLEIKEISRKQDTMNETLIKHGMRLDSLEARISSLERENLEK